MTLLLLISLITIMLLVCAAVRGDFMEPAFIFSAVFVFSAIWLVAFAPVWNFSLHENTFWVVIGGVVTFCLFSVFRSLFRFKPLLECRDLSYELLPINIQKSKLLIFILIQAFTIFYSLYLKLQFAGGSFATLFATMSSYRASIMFYGGESLAFPKWLNLLNSCVTSAGYWFCYVLVNNYIVQKKIDKYALTVFVLCIANTVFTTSRGGTFDYLMAMIIFYIMLYRMKHNRIRRINMKTLITIAAFLLIFVFTFPIIGNLIGRGSSETIGDYLARYCGAGIANLDSFLQSRKPQTRIWGQESFIYVIRWVGGKLGISNTMYDLDLPFIKVNGKNLGNVYTTFYPFIYDFGYIGVFFMTALMAMITQGIYKSALKVKFDYRPSKSILMYGFILPTIAMSFFSNKFYEKLFNPSFMYTFLFWLVFEFIFCNKRRRIIKFVKH